MKNFIIKLTIITLCVALISGLVFYMFLPEYYLPVLPFLLLFFYGVTLGIHAYQLRLAKTDMGKFTRSTMLITFFKLVLYSLLAIVYIVIHKKDSVVFVICLMALYIVFTFIEVSESIKQTSSKKS